MGVGFHEAPRGVLSHWVVIDSGKIKNYQCVVPTTWNAAPRNEKDQPGAYEACLIDNPVADRRTAGSAAHRAFLRPLPGLRRACGRSGKQSGGDRQGCLIDNKSTLRWGRDNARAPFLN